MRALGVRRVLVAGVLATAGLAQGSAPDVTGAAPPASDNAGRPAVRELLCRGDEAAEPTRVLVLGTMHLRELGARLNRAALNPVLEVLERWQPTMVLVEAIPGPELAAMAASGGTLLQVAKMFGERRLELGEVAQRHLGLGREEASAAAEGALASGPLSPTQRRTVAAQLVAALEMPSALLQWSYLESAQRRPGADLPPAVVEGLEQELAAANEIPALAVPLARHEGLQRLAGIDSQRDGARMLRMPEAEIEELFGHPRGAAAMKRHPADHAAIAAANVAGDLLPAYRLLNSDGYGRADVESQWGWLLDVRLESGLDRYRLGQWQSRNLRIAANIGDVIDSRRPERVVVLIGAAHKPFLDDLLGRLAGVKLVQLDDLVAEAPEGAVTGDVLD